MRKLIAWVPRPIIGAPSIKECYLVPVPGLIAPTLRVRNRMVRLQRLRQLEAPPAIMRTEIAALRHESEMLGKACRRLLASAKWREA